MSALLFLILQGCVTTPRPYYDDYAGGGSYGPPPIGSHYSPNMVVIPDTNDVYFASDLAAELFFWNGLWWRPWRGSWYYSRDYNRNWSYFRSGIPRFYYDIDPHWREYYQNRDWHGHRWDYERIPSHKLQKNWEKWQKDRYWERQRTWDVHDYKPDRRHQRQDLRDQEHQQYQDRRSPVPQSQWQPPVQEPQRQVRFEQAQRPSRVQQPWTQTRVWQPEKETRTRQTQQQARIEELRNQVQERQAVKESRARQLEREASLQRQQKQNRIEELRSQRQERQAVKQARVQQRKENFQVQQRSKEETKERSSRRQLERENDSRKDGEDWERNDWMRPGRK